MANPTQWTNRGEVPDGEHKNWRAIAKRIIAETTEQLREKGLRPDASPEMPPLVDGLQGYSTPEWRVLFMWIPYWAASEDCGKFVVRVDTLIQPIRLGSEERWEGEQ